MKCFVIFCLCALGIIGGVCIGHDEGYNKGIEYRSALEEIAKTAVIKAEMAYFIAELKTSEKEVEPLKKNLSYSIKSALRAIPTEYSQKNVESLATIIEQAVEWEIMSWKEIGYENKDDFLKNCTELKEKMADLVCTFQNAIKTMSHPETYSREEFKSLGELIKQSVNWGIVSWEELGYVSEEDYLQDWDEENSLYGYAIY